MRPIRYSPSDPTSSSSPMKRTAASTTFWPPICAGAAQRRFLGFTGTPLIAGEEERTREVFGDYVSIYDFAQSIIDGATVPLYYESRLPELQLKQRTWKTRSRVLSMKQTWTRRQEERLARRFARQYQLITNDDRLDKIAQDLVRHFSARGYRGKAMFIAIDKATAVRMYDKVQQHWRQC